MWEGISNIVNFLRGYTQYYLLCETRKEKEQKSRIRETMNFSTNADISTDTKTDRNEPSVGGGNNRTVTESSFRHITTKTWGYSGVFSLFREKKFRRKKFPPPHPNYFLKIQWDIHFFERHFWDKTLHKKN